MFVRIVKMGFKNENIVTFLKNFNDNKTKIRAFKGCNFLELYRDKNNPTIFFTYSYWETETDLERYRQSDLFKTVWSKTKPLFNIKPEAWSVDKNLKSNMKIIKKLILPYYLKVIISILLTIIIFNCSKDNDNNINSSKTKLLAIDGVGSKLRIVELNSINGSLISEFLKFEVLQASVDFDFTFFKLTNENKIQLAQRLIVK